MKIGSRVLVLSTLCGVAACADPGTPTTTYDSPLFELESTLHHTGDHLGLPVGIKVIGRDLLILDHQGSKGVHVVDAVTGELRASVGGVGEGPREFRAPISIALDSAGAVWVIDGTNQRGTLIDLSRLDDESAWAGQTIAISAGVAVVDAAWTRQGALVAAGLFSRGTLAIIDGTGGLLTEVREIAPGPERGVYELMNHLGRLDAHPDLTRFAAVELWYPRIRILTEDGQVERVVESPVHTEPEFLAVEGRLIPSDDSFNAYVDVAVSSTHIYALYCGRTRNSHGNRQTLGRDVHVFDWDGNLVTVLRLNRDALTLGVDEEGGRLFTVELDPVPAVLSYDLPALLR